METKDLESTLASRISQHGDFTDNAGVSQELQSIFRVSKNWEKLSCIQREALQIIAHKIGRILSGDWNFADHWHDIAGYAKCVEDRLPKIDKGASIEIKSKAIFEGVDDLSNTPPMNDSPGSQLFRISAFYNTGSKDEPNWVRLGTIPHSIPPDPIPEQDKPQRCPSCGGSGRSPIPGCVRCEDPNCDCYLQTCTTCFGTGGVKHGTI